MPFFVSPHLKNGGFLGESKWDYLKYMDPDEVSTLPAVLLPHGTSVGEVLMSLRQAKLQFPLVFKPDVGQRGFGVRVVRNTDDVFRYWEQRSGDVIAPQKSQYDHEAGVFFVRPPRQQARLFSMTKKIFPQVVGDGCSRLGDLILADHRARVLADIYLKRYYSHLEEIPPVGSQLSLTECGNHCQGAIFKDGAHLATPQLLDAVEKVVNTLPDFCFGRLDIRYKNDADLRRGKNFEVIEINGAGSEATHIWDDGTSLWSAYGVLFRQWHLLFELGLARKLSGGACGFRLRDLLAEFQNILGRSKSLSLSS